MPAAEGAGVAADDEVLVTVLTAALLRFCSFFFLRFESVGSLHSQVDHDACTARVLCTVQTSCFDGVFLFLPANFISKKYGPSAFKRTFNHKLRTKTHLDTLL